MAAQAEEQNFDPSFGTASKENIFNIDFVRIPHILPAEIWKLVSNRLLKLSPNDLENLHLSSSYFQNLLADQRTEFLFGKVLPLVTSSVWKDGDLEGFPMSDVFKCRGVCKNWNAVIDKWIPDKHQSLIAVSDDNQTLTKLREKFTSCLLRYEFSNLNGEAGSWQTVQKFLQHFDHSHPPNGRNPITWNNFSVNLTEGEEGDDDEQDFQKFLDGISSVLVKYGRHLHKFTVENNRQDFYENPSKLREWLSYMPNLKIFKYGCDENWIENADLSSNPRVDPFPNFKYLQTLEIDGLAEPVGSQLICQNPHISSLFLSSMHCEYNIWRLSLPNLKNLKLALDLSRISETLGFFQFQCPVESLKLKLHAFWHGDLFGCSILFQVIKDKFATSLVSLDLHVSLIIKKNRAAHRQIFEDCKTCRLDLPNLKKIRIDIPKVLISLDFLLPMKKHLEEIAVSVGYDSHEFPKTNLVNGTIVQFMGFEGKMLDSNIWAIFKKLEKVEVKAKWDGSNEETRRYCREEWLLSNEYT